MLMGRDKSIAPLLSMGDEHKQLKRKNAHGDRDAAMAKAAAVVTYVQSLSQEVGSGDEGLGLFGLICHQQELALVAGRGAGGGIETNTWF